MREIALLDSWKFLKRGFEWLYNPRCTGFTDDAQPTENARLVTVMRRRPIDYPALGVHIRHAVGSRDWGRFLERYALPKPAVFMHPGATNEQRGDYLEGAQAVENGQVSVWPNGASLTDFAGGARGTDPFSAFIEHQEKQIVLLATGGTLMSLAESGAGTLAGNAQSDVWHSIVARDSSVIAQAVNKMLLKPYLERTFPGQPKAVQFGFDFTVPPTPKEVFEVAALAKQAGYAIDLTELEEQTGYTLKQVEVEPQGAPMHQGYEPRLALPFANKEADPSGARPLADGGSPLKSNPTKRPSGTNAVLQAFASDTGAAAEAVKKLLENPSPDAAAALLKDLPSLLPDDPALAAVIADAMAEQFGKTVTNKTDANGMEHADSGEGGGRFVEKGEGASGTPSDKTERKNPQTAEDYRKLADSVSKERIAQICAADVKQPCKIEEAIAVLRTNPKVINALGEEVTFGYDMAEKYLTGRFRSGNVPKPENLKDLQIAMYAVKHDKSPKLQYLRGAIHDPLIPPRGTQRVYTVPASEGPMLARAWADSGKVTGWYVETKKPTDEGGGRKRAKKA